MEGTPEPPDDAAHAPAPESAAGPAPEPQQRRSRDRGKEGGRRRGAARAASARYSQSARSVLRPLPARVVLITAIAGIAAVGATGGFAPVELVDVPEVEPGTVMELGPYTARVESFFVTDQVATSALESQEGAEAWLGVRAHIENTWTEPRVVSDSSFTPLLDGEEVAPDGRPTDMLVRDGSTYVTLQPNLPEDVLMLWPIPDADAIGDEVTVRMDSLVYVDSELLGAWDWLRPQPVALVTLERDDDLPPQVIDPPEEEDT
ncbi:hypothetical protein Bcav_0459 [Beutenbergia cavernae DSM 12333]|uniref:DUF4352 domain-containing protein n=1 Tax=Beutenbergia cavernae (strain ATCC BAA-8 / DSM 12333 / CCUG 43141 / JCM 11478 / NBRC 16432 / NCIMB 13614 / HKI 0122) TaxID=471853 RepID=C5BX47_BEUC1|nr:hypothetical protein [Beutenbergia cavernae]ACQ78722.1 hypothetical protein Bcav_0459 [Beutenbergia cavernae DSM 12333]